MKYIYFLFFLIFALYSCKNDEVTEKYLKSRDNIVKVREQIKEVLTGEPYITSWGELCILDKYLIIKDSKSYDSLIHVFDKNTFQHIKSTGVMGPGPKDITRIGEMFPNETDKKLYVFDMGKIRLLSFDLDSLINVPDYKFSIKASFEKGIYPVSCHYISDTLVVAERLAWSDNVSGAVVALDLWNMQTGLFKKGYQHPVQPERPIQTNAFHFTASPQNSIYVMCSRFYDLMTICNLDGSLKYNVYGPNWTEKITSTCHYNMGVCIGRDKIYALYAGVHHHSPNRYPSQMFVYDVNGNYLKTLDMGYRIVDFCYDEEHHRLILHADDDIQFGYLDLEGII